MIKQIELQQLRVGMFVHKLGGSWLDHPFWKKAFLVEDTAQVRRVAQSGIHGIWIDTARGVDVARDDEGDVDEEVDAAHLATRIATMIEPPAPLAEPTACSLSDELERAARIIAAARSSMKHMFEDARLGAAIDVEHCLPLVEDITGSVARNGAAIVSLARLKTSDDYTYMHSVAVCALMIALARRLGLDDVAVRDAGTAGLVHDMGKALMPVGVLNKSGALTDAEFAVMRGHPEAGWRLLRESNGFGTVALDVCLHHHERVDGKGYPHGLAGDAIGLLAKMGAVCDVYDAITSNRVYKPGWNPARSIREMAQWTRDGHFDDAVFQAFVKSVGIYPIGSLVRLASGRLAVVVDEARGSLLKPTVRTVLDVGTREARADRIDLAAAGCDDRIVGREDPAAWGLAGLDDVWKATA